MENLSALEVFLTVASVAGSMGAAAFLAAILWRHSGPKAPDQVRIDRLVETAPYDKLHNVMTQRR